jgi:hypothetical protein
MGEGALPGGIFRKSAPGEVEINIPGIVESPVNRIIRQSYRGKHKGEPSTLVRTPDDKLYPRGFTPPADFITNVDKTQGVYNLSNTNRNVYDDLPVEAGLQVNLAGKVERTLQSKYLSLQEGPLRFFDSPSVQFRHLLEYNDTSQNNYRNPILKGSDGNRPGITYDFDENGKLTSPTYLASFVRTQRENEDPTLLGFDFNVSLPNSPLFNGTCEKFIIDYGGSNTEIKNRLYLLHEFQQQFLNFFKTYEPNHLSENLPSVGQFIDNDGDSSSGSDEEKSFGNQKSYQLTNKLLKNKQGITNDPKFPQDSSRDMRDTYLGSAVKAYYLQSISGLNKLNESNSYSEGQRFVKWGTDFLTLTMNEDVSQNMGYLAALYKNLAWSRERGRLAIPENLLRFEVVLDITEIRNYVRIYHNSVDPNQIQISNPIGDETLGTRNKDWITIADQTSKYRYFVHECQLFFPEMPHGDTLTNAPSDYVKGLDMKIFFKNSNLRFMKFSPPLNGKVKDDDYTGYLNRYTNNNMDGSDDYFGIKVVDNSIALPTSTVGDDTLYGGQSEFTKTVFDNGNGPEPTLRNTAPMGYPVEIFNEAEQQLINSINTNVGLSDEERRRQINRLPFVDQIKVGIKDQFKQIKKAALGNALNLINRQLTSVASLVNRTLNQIYNSTPVIGGIKPPKNIYEKPNEFEQAYIDFIGPGLKTFFEDPIKFRKEGQPGETLEQRISKGRQENPNPRPGRSTEDYFQLANQAQPTARNRKLKQIVDSDPALGNGFSGASTIPFLGNSADTGQNKTLKQIVDGNPGLGNNQTTNFSNIPSLGNSADTGPNKTLKQIVDANPSLGNGSGISRIPFLGNRARSTSNNRTLSQIVAADPNLGNGSKLLKGFFSTNTNTGNNATSGANLNLLDLIMNNSIVTTLGAFDWDNIQYPASAQRLPQPTNSGIQDLNDLIKEYTSLDRANLGNSAELGPNDLLQTILNSNTQLNNPSLGNSGELGPNTTNNSIVSSNSTVNNPNEGNSALDGDNIPNDILVQNTSGLVNPFEGNSAELGSNILSSELISNTSGLLNPSLGNNADPNKNIESSELVSNTSKVVNSSLGNSSVIGNNKSSNTIVKNESDVINPSLGNSSTTSSNQTLQKLVSGKTSLGQASLGNGGSVGGNSKLSEVISGSNLTDPGLGNSGRIGGNNKLSDILSNSNLTEPNLGNSGRIGGNNPKQTIINENSNLQDASIGNGGRSGVPIGKDNLVRENSGLNDTEVGNNARFGSNSDLSSKISKNSGLENQSQGNSGLSGYNLPKEDTIQANSKISNPQIGNSGLSGNNDRTDFKVGKNSELSESTVSTSRTVGDSKKLDEIVGKQSQVENPNLANSATRGENLNLKGFSKYSSSRLYGTVDWNNIQFPKSGNKYPPPTTEK